MVPSKPTAAPDAPLSAAELGQAEALVAEAGWNQTLADWKIFLDFGTVRTARAEGRVVATAASLPYGGSFAWISMVLVAGSHRRRGLATALLKRCVEDLTADGLIPILDAAPAGREVYRPLGFRDSWRFTRLAMPASRRQPAAPSLPAGIEIRPIDDAIWPDVCTCDAASFGAARPEVLARLRGRVAKADLVVLNQGRVAGFMLARDGRLTTQLGPVIAQNDGIAQSLIAHGLAAAPGPLCLDVPDSKPGLRAWLEAQGASAVRPFIRMALGRDRGFDDPATISAVAGPELG